jgi:hypothetical protein
MVLRSALAWSILLAACAASAPRTLVLRPPPDQGSIAVGDCKGEQAVPAEGKKRFAVHLSRTSGANVWAELEGVGTMSFAGLGDQLDACFLVELPAGKYHFTVRGQGRTGEGVGLGARVTELAFAPDGALWWYGTFQLDCGAPGACDKAGLAEWKRVTQALPRKLGDPCGSTKVRDSQWAVGRSADEAHPDDLGVQVVLDVYPFVPQAGPGQCGKEDADAESGFDE